MQQETNQVITLKNADILGGENIVLYDLNMEINPGDFVYIVGKVGTGKTSIFRTLIAESRPAKGSCRVCGYDIKTIRNREIPKLRRKIGVIFQDFQLLPDRNVHDNLAFVLGSTGWKDRAGIDKRISEVLKKVGMATKEHRFPYQMSGGEQQRIAIARSILNDPELILADEPTGNLDEDTAGSIMELLMEINRNGTTVVMVTHNRSLLDRFPGRVFECKNETCCE